MTEATERRFRQYYVRVRARLRAVDASDQERERISHSIHAFVLNDLGEAYAYGAGLYWFTHDERRRCRAVKALLRATKENGQFLLPYATLAILDYSRDDRHWYLERGLELEPEWPAGMLALAQHHAFAIADGRELARNLRSAKAKRKKLLRARRRRHLFWWRQGPSLERRQRWLEKVEANIAQWEEELRQCCEKAEKHRETALRLVHKVLPHQWLWDGDQLNFAALMRAASGRERRLVRDLTFLHAEALYAGVRCFLFVEKRAGRTIRALEQILKFWPGNPHVLTDLVDAKRTRVDEAGQHALVKSALDENPAAVLYLVERRIPVTAQQLIACDTEAFRMRGDYRELYEMRFRRKDMYRKVTKQCGDDAAVKVICEAAAKVFNDGWGYAELAGHLCERAIEEESRQLLSAALSAAVEALKREPNNRRYQRVLSYLQRLQRFGICSIALSARCERFAIEYSKDLSPDELQTSCEAVRQQVHRTLGLPVPEPEIRPGADLAERQCRILIDDRMAGTFTLDAAGEPEESLPARLQPILIHNGPSFLRLDDVLMLLNDGDGLGDQVRAEGLLPEITRVFRALFEEGVPLDQPHAIVKAFRAVWRPGRTLTAVAEDVRDHPDVRGRLPSAAPGRTQRVVRIDPASEDVVRQGLRAGGGAIMALDPKITEALRHRIRELFTDTTGNDDLVLVTTSDLRPWVKAIVEGCVERLVVASDRQLFADDSWILVGTADSSAAGAEVGGSA